MKTEAKNLSISFILLLTIFLLSVSVFAQPEEDRLIKKYSWLKEPVKITNFKIEKLSVKFNEKFKAKNNWLSGLILTVTNISDKDVCYISVALDFPRTIGQEPPIRDHLLWNCKTPTTNTIKSSERITPLKPGESLDLILSDKAYREMQEFLKERNYLESISLLEVTMNEVGFTGESGTLWMSGLMMRRDPNNPTLWYPIKP